MKPAKLRRRFAPLLAGLPDDDISALIRAAAVSRVAAGDRVIGQGYHNETLYLIWSGRLSMKVEAGDISIAMPDVGPGRWVGDIGLLAPGSAPVEVRAVKDSTLVGIDVPTLESFEKTRPAVFEALLSGLSESLAKRLDEGQLPNLQPTGDGPSAFKQGDEHAGSLVAFLSSLLGGGRST